MTGLCDEEQDVDGELGTRSATVCDSAPARAMSLALASFEILLIFTLYFAYAGWPPPAINEAHYLVKARHFWDPNWCPGDLFAESADTHYLFYLTLGPLTGWLPLPWAAWVCRAVIWLLLAIGWRRLSFTLVPRPLVSLLTAGLYLCLLDHTQMAGEWVVGGAEAKCLAYAAVWWGLAELARNRWRAALLWLGFAAGWHVLVGGWALVALGVAWLWDGERPAIRSLICALGGALLLSLPGWWPALAMDRGSPPEVLAEAHRIHVFERLSHHLVFYRFPRGFMLRHGLAIGVWWLLHRAADQTPAGRRVGRVVGGAIAICLVGVLIDQSNLYAPQRAAAWLRFYWFRLSDALVPLGIALGLGELWQRLRVRQSPLADWGLLGLILGVSAWLGGHYLRAMHDLRPQADRPSRVVGPDSAPPDEMTRHRDWLAVCAWMARHTKASDWTIAPRDRQTFKWYTGHAEFVCRKDVPQDAASTVEWKRRIEMLYGDPYRIWPDRIRRIAAEYPVRYVIVDRQSPLMPLPYPIVYPSPFDTNRHFVVYRIPAEPRENGRPNVEPTSGASSALGAGVEVVAGSTE